MTMTITAIDEIPLLEDDPDARASYRVAVSSGETNYQLLFTLLTVSFDASHKEIFLIHSHTWELDRALVPPHLDFGDRHPLYRLVTSTFLGDRPTLPVVISDRKPIVDTDDV